MKRTVSVLGFAGYSGSGKTTLIERLVPLLEEKGIRTAVIKHDAHGLRFDTEGKDSQRFSAAGTACSLVNGPEQSAVDSLLTRKRTGTERGLSPEASDTGGIRPRGGAALWRRIRHNRGLQAQFLPTDRSDASGDRKGIPSCGRALRGAGDGR